MFRPLSLGIVLLCALTAVAAADIELPSGGPFVPTPQPVVDEMLVLAGVHQRDFVIDLGSGDGRIVLTAARQYRARGVVEGDHMRGETVLNGETVSWTATRIMAAR